MIRSVSLLIAAAALVTSPAQAENWSNWRGPLLNGSSPETNLPEKFSRTENVKWSIRLPGEGASSPIIHGDHVFITSANPSGSNSVAIALDRKTGKELWRHTAPGVGRDNRSNYASSSPVTDGEIVVFFFGNGVMFATDFSGKELWRRDITKDHGDFAFQWTFSSSPVLHGGKLYLQVLQRDEPVNGKGKQGGKSYLLAMEPATGEDIWKHIRPAKAVRESLEAFTTPIPMTHDGRDELVIIGGDCVTGHDPETGKELWRWGTWNLERIAHWRIVPSPVYGEGTILVCAPKNEPVYAVKAGLKGMVGDDKALKWVSDPSKEVPVSSDVSTPLYMDGRFYILNSQARTLNCVVPETGEIIYSQRLDSAEKLEASPTGGDGKIYLVNHLGDVFVVKAGDKFELLHETQMGETQKNISRASISISQGNLYLRTDTHLFCIGS